MFAAHMDEIGIIVTDIDDKGFVRFSSVGGLNLRNLVNLRVRFANGVEGVIGAEEESFKDKPAISKLYVDLGAADKKETEKIVSIGDTASFVGGFVKCGDKVVSKALDNRVGCAILMQALSEIKDCENDLYFVFTTQEEVGLRGAHTSTTKFDPEVFFAVDCSPAGDIYGNQGKVGDGTLIRFFDPGHIMLPNMKDFLLTTAEEAGIKYQYYCAAGGTDAGAAHLQNAGVPSTTIGVCARYIHSHQTLYAMDDFLEAQAFLQAIVKKLDRSTVDLIKNY